MLVLSRKEGEGIQIGSNVTVTVVEIRGNKIRLGINAPRDVPVHRDEVLRAIALIEEAQPSPEESENPVQPTCSSS